MSVDKACRVCLSQCEELTPLWVQLPGENKTLKEAINFVANINIKIEDGLPVKICNTCESVLDLANTFKQRCLESESILERQAQEQQSDESRTKNEKSKQDVSETEFTESAENTNCPPKIKIEIEDIKNEIENLDTTEYELLIEHCSIKQEIPAEAVKYPVNKETFCCPHCSLTFENKLSYKVHIHFVHSSLGHRKDARSLKKTKLDATHPTTAEVRSATEDPAAADTSSETEHDFQAENSNVNKKRKHQKNLKDSTKDTANVRKLSGTKTGDKSTCATEKQSECSNNTVIGALVDMPTCDICGYTTQTLKYLTSHLIAHAATKRYSCDSCLYITVNSSNFKNHLESHTSDRPYACDKCDKRFRKSFTLAAHMRIHTNNKPYSCDVCQMKFYRKSDVSNHLVSHSDIKPYSCDVCGKKFKRKYNVREHRKNTHTDEKSYSCGMCNKTYNWKRDLLKHEKKHTGEKGYMHRQ